MHVRDALGLRGMAMSPNFDALVVVRLVLADDRLADDVKAVSVCPRQHRVGPLGEIVERSIG